MARPNERGCSSASMTGRARARRPPPWCLPPRQRLPSRTACWEDLLMPESSDGPVASAASGRASAEHDAHEANEPNRLSYVAGIEATQEVAHSHGPLAAMAIAAIGVVYGDIGTSPLYALRECLSPHYGIA